MHEAEDMLMETGAILPIYYYNDLYMQDSAVTNIYSNLFGYKFFMYANKEGDTTLRACLPPSPTSSTRRSTAPWTAPLWR